MGSINNYRNRSLGERIGKIITIINFCISWYFEFALIFNAFLIHAFVWIFLLQCNTIIFNIFVWICHIPTITSYFDEQSISCCYENLCNCPFAILFKLYNTPIAANAQHAPHWCPSSFTAVTAPYATQSTSPTLIYSYYFVFEFILDYLTITFDKYIYAN